jgi:hypothetical protein
MSGFHRRPASRVPVSRAGPAPRWSWAGDRRSLDVRQRRRASSGWCRPGLEEREHRAPQATLIRKPGPGARRRHPRGSAAQPGTPAPARDESPWAGSSLSNAMRGSLLKLPAVGWSDEIDASPARRAGRPGPEDLLRKYLRRSVSARWHQEVARSGKKDRARPKPAPGHLGGADDARRARGLRRTAKADGRDPGHGGAGRRCCRAGTQKRVRPTLR